MYKGSRLLLPKSLRPGMLRALHCGHAGVVGMQARAREVAWWPGITQAIEDTRATCKTCHENSPSNPKQPAMGVLKTSFAYEALSIDHFYLKGVEFLAVSDRHSGMISVHATRHRGSKEYLKILRQHCVRNGVPVSIYTDGSSVFTSAEVKDFCERYNIKHFVSSVSNPHSNLRAEVGVRILKRILRDIVTETGNLNTDAVTEALLIYHNTKCQVLGKSPSELANGRILKDFLPRDFSTLLPAPEKLMSGVVKDKLQEEIRLAGGQRWSEHTRRLAPLEMGCWVQLQNLRGPHPLKSDSNGVVIGKHNVNSYVIRVNGSGKITIRNRCSLRVIPKPPKITLPVSLPGVVSRHGDRAPAPAGSGGHGGNVLRQRSQGTDNVSQSGGKSQDSQHGKSQDSQHGNVQMEIPLIEKESGSFQRPGGQHGNIPLKGPLTADKTCDSLLRQVADWDIPGNILYEAFHKPKNSEADSTVLGARRKQAAIPAPAPRHHSPGGLGASGGHTGDRSDVTQSHVSADVSVQDTPVRSDTVGDRASQPDQEVLSRRSSRHRRHVVKFQAGSSGMEST
jgi:hypothetical protein